MRGGKKRQSGQGCGKGYNYTSKKDLNDIFNESEENPYFIQQNAGIEC